MKLRYVSSNLIGRDVPRAKSDECKGKVNAKVIRDIKSRQPYY